MIVKNFPIIQLGKVLRQRSEFVEIDDFTDYKRCRVQWYGQGIIERDIVPGIEIKTKKQQICLTEEFLVAEIDAKLGGFGIVPDNLDSTIVSGHYFLFVLNKTLLDPSFLKFFIRTSTFMEQVKAQGTTNYAAIRPGDVLEYEIPLPPLSEQRRIVARIEELAARIKEARGLRREAVEEAVKLWESSLRAMFEQLAKDYQHKTFREVCNVVRGGSPRPAGDPTYYDGSIPFLKVADLTADTHKYVTTHSATIKEAGLSHSRYVESNTLMLTNSGATLGVPKICTFGTCFNDGVQAFLNIPNNIAKEYLYYFLLSKTRWFRKWAARGQGQPNLNTEMVKGIEFPLPPLAEQCHIVAYLDDLRSKADILGHLQSETSIELDALLPSILDKAFKGEL